MTDVQLPENLRRLVQRDLQPVRPVASPFHRTTLVAAVSLLIMAAIVTTSALRPDLSSLPIWLGWGSSAVEIMLGLALVCAAVREGIPAASLPLGLRWVLLGAAVLVNFSTAVVTWLHSHGPASSHQACLGYVCLRSELLLGLPALALTLFLVVRAYPLRPSLAGLFGGAGAGLLADGVEHLLCPVSDLTHVLVWHTGAIVLLMLFGWLAGTIWETLRDGNHRPPSRPEGGEE